ncbi:uncharacterized protein LOC135102884 isoform X1 [Scylla paramamosain]|uniref:uncharacterized protein LOC135102884 isoform X1 n=1 Tax=Scylla paramamosain TaxID=85552 RepID=UPI003082DA3C
MARGSRRGPRREETLGARSCVVQAPPRTRSQALRENQEIEIQHTVTYKKENGYVSGYVKDVSKTPSPTRDGSPDSAISSNSSKWSVSSNISIMGRLSVCGDSESVTALSPVVEEAARGSNGSVNPNTVKWVNNIVTERTRAATPLIRTSAAANGSLMRHTGSLVAESSNVMEGHFLNKAKMVYVNSGFTSELVVHLYIIASCASSASTKAELEKIESVTPVSHLLPLHPVALQVAAWFVIGSLYDLISPRTALLLPEVVVLLLHLMHYSSFGKLCSHFHSYMSSIKMGLLGSHLLAVHLGYRHNLAGMLSRVSFCYGLCTTLFPAVARMVSQHLGNSINYQLLTLLSLLSIISTLSILGSNTPTISGLLPIVSGRLSWVNLIGCLTMKFAVTVLASSLLPWLDALLRDNSEKMGLPEVVTSGLLCTPAVIVPFLLLCTTIPTAISAMAFLLTLFYLFMILVGVSESYTLVLLIPMCGLMGVIQNLVLASLLTTSLHYPGFLLASNLALHTATRYYIPSLIAQLLPLCADSTKNVISLTCWQWLNKTIKDKFQLQYLPAVSSYSLELVSCQNIHLHIIVVIGFLCSLLLILLAKYARV